MREEGFEKGHEEGFEKGHEEGFEKGHEEGREEGLIKGRKAEKKSIIEKMQQKGMTMQDISGILNMEISEIEELLSDKDIVA